MQQGAPQSCGFVPCDSEPEEVQQSAPKTCGFLPCDSEPDEVVVEPEGADGTKVISLCDVLSRIDARRLHVQTNWLLNWRGQGLNRYSPYGPIAVRDKAAFVRAAQKEPQHDKAMGCMCGMAIADGLGHMLEFLPAVDEPDPCGPYFNVAEDTFNLPKNQFRLKRGQWTDDCSMGLCLADSLVLRRQLDGSDLRIRFWSWWFAGYNNAFRKDSSRSESVGLGGNISRSLYSLKPGVTPPPRFQSPSEDAGNGSLMRLAPVPIFFQSVPQEELFAHARDSSYTTHPGIIAAEACCFLAFLIVHALRVPLEPAPDPRAFLDSTCAAFLSQLGDRSGWGYDQMRQLAASAPERDKEACWNWRKSPLPIQRTLEARGSTYNGYPVSAGYFGSYAPDALAVALHSVYHSESFEGTIAHCINLLGDADSTGSVAGQIAGALYGYSRIPRQWLSDLEKWDDFEVPLRGVLLVALGKDPEAFAMPAQSPRSRDSSPVCPWRRRPFCCWPVL